MSNRQRRVTLKRYVRCNRKAHTWVGGHCFGALVGFEIAQQLVRAGDSVALVAAIDVPAPRANANPFTCREGDDATWVFQLGRLLEQVSGKDLALSYEDLRTRDPEAQLIYLRDRMQRTDFLPVGAGVDPVRGFVSVFKANSTARYQPRDIQPVPIALFRAAEFHPDYDYSSAEDPGHTLATSTLGWRAYASGSVDVEIVPGNHITMMSEPNVRVLAKRLGQRLRDAEKSSRAIPIAV